MSDSDLSNVAAALRAQFDAGFADAPVEPGTPPMPYLRIALGGRPWLVALDAVGGVFADRPVTPLPSTAPELLGVAALHGDVVPVFGLAALLGLAPGDAAPRWLLVSAGAPRIGFAFDALEAQLRIAPGDIAAGAGGQAQASARIDGDSCPILDLAVLRKQLENRLDTARGGA